MPKYEHIAEAPVAVQKRYFRIKYSGYFMKIGRFCLRLYLILTERNKNRVLASTLETFKIETERARKNGNECTQALMNIGLYFLIAEKDIQTVKIDALTHHDEWKRLLSLRVILLTIYEWDMGKASSKDLRNLLIQSAVDDNLRIELFRALKLLRKSREKAANQLRFERNNIIAHRNSDALLQLDTIQSLSRKKVMNAAEDFYVSSAMFMRVFPQILHQAGSVQGLFSFMSNNKD